MEPIRRTVLIHKESMPRMYALATRLLDDEKKKKRLQKELQSRLEQSFTLERQLASAEEEIARLQETQTVLEQQIAVKQDVVTVKKKGELLREELEKLREETRSLREENQQLFHLLRQQKIPVDPSQFTQTIKPSGMRHLKRVRRGEHE